MWWLWKNLIRLFFSLEFDITAGVLMKKLVVNQDTCVGCGTCSSLAAKTFVLGDNSKAKVTNPPGNSEEEIQNAIDSCPVEAISWVEEGVQNEQ